MESADAPDVSTKRGECGRREVGGCTAGSRPMIEGTPFFCLKRWNQVVGNSCSLRQAHGSTYVLTTRNKKTTEMTRSRRLGDNSQESGHTPYLTPLSLDDSRPREKVWSERSSGARLLTCVSNSEVLLSCCCLVADSNEPHCQM